MKNQEKSSKMGYINFRSTLKKLDTRNFFLSVICLFMIDYLQVQLIKNGPDIIEPPQNSHSKFAFFGENPPKY